MAALNQTLGSIGSGIDFIAQNNVTNDYIIALAIVAGIILVLRLFRMVVIIELEKFAKKTKTFYDDAVVEFIKSFGWPFFFMAAIISGLKFLVLPPSIDSFLFYVIFTLAIAYTIKGMFASIDFIINMTITAKEKKEEDTSILHIMSALIKIVVVIILVLLLLANLGINISSLLAGLGIGGIAVAFALQNILSDLFSAFTIYLDKPFRKGDFIIIGTDMGTIEKIGLKSTRIRTLQGQELIVGNSELTSTRINNYKQMKKRRIIFSFGVEYSTSYDKLKKIPGMVQRIIEGIEKAEFDRSHLKSFGDSSLDFETAFYVNTPEYKDYMDIQQRINLSLVKEFEKRGISFAFPTRTIHMQGRDTKKTARKTSKSR